jgi:hypothetical protein
VAQKNQAPAAKARPDRKEKVFKGISARKKNPHRFARRGSLYRDGLRRFGRVTIQRFTKNIAPLASGLAVFRVCFSWEQQAPFSAQAALALLLTLALSAQDVLFLSQVFPSPARATGKEATAANIKQAMSFFIG